MTVEDKTTIQQDLTQLISMLANELSMVQQPSLAPHASAEERHAARRLYEAIMDYRGSCWRRPLRASIEFIGGGPIGGAFHGHPGWYYKAGASAGGKPSSTGAFNWYGPFASHHEALVARDKDKPRTIVKHTISKFLNDPELVA